MDTIGYQAIIAQARTPGGHALALTAGGDGYVYQAILEWERADQSWLIQSERLGSCFSIYSKSMNKYVARQKNNNCLILVDRAYLDQDNDDAKLALWRNEGDVENYHPINSLQDWEQKINMLGNGPYLPGNIVFTWGWSGGAPNEMWDIVPIQVQTNVSIQYFDPFTISDVSDGAEILFPAENFTNSAQEQDIDIAFEHTDEYSFKKEHGTEVSETIEFEADLPIIGKTKSKTSVKGTWKYSESNTHTSTQKISTKIKVTVPPQSKIFVVAKMMRGNLMMPYTATVTYTYPDGSTEQMTQSGTYVCTYGYNFSTKWVQDGTIQEHFVSEIVDRYGRHKTRGLAAAAPNRALIHSN